MRSHPEAALYAGDIGEYKVSLKSILNPTGFGNYLICKFTSGESRHIGAGSTASTASTATGA